MFQRHSASTALRPQPSARLAAELGLDTLRHLRLPPPCACRGADDEGCPEADSLGFSFAVPGIAAGRYYWFAVGRFDAVATRVKLRLAWATAANLPTRTPSGTATAGSKKQLPAAGGGGGASAGNALPTAGNAVARPANGAGTGAAAAAVGAATVGAQPVQQRTPTQPMPTPAEPKPADAAPQAAPEQPPQMG